MNGEYNIDEIYSSEELELFAATLCRTGKGTLIDPRYVSGLLRDRLLGYQLREQWWLDRKLQVQHRAQARILIGFSDQMHRSQAFAIYDKSSGRSFIVLSAHLVMLMSTYASFAMCLPDVLEEFGSIAREVWPRVEENGQLDLIPRCPEREKIARLVQRMIFRFIISHELVHILHGHLQVRDTPLQVISLQEETTFASEVNARIDQTLEIDADNGAIAEILGDGSIFLETFNDGAERDWLRPGNLPLSPERIMKLWFFSLYSAFRILDNGRKPPPLRTSSHPRAMFRYVSIFLSLQARLQGQDAADQQDRSARVFTEASRDAKKTFIQFGIAEVQLGSPDDITYGLSETYMPMINLEWTLLRPKLVTLSKSAVELPLTLIHDQFYVTVVAQILKHQHLTLDELGQRLRVKYGERVLGLFKRKHTINTSFTHQISPMPLFSATWTGRIDQ